MSINFCTLLCVTGVSPQIIQYNTFFLLNYNIVSSVLKEQDEEVLDCQTEKDRLQINHHTAGTFLVVSYDYVPMACVEL